MSKITAGFRSSIEYFREAIIEIRKVSWPSKERTISDSIIVIIGSLLVAAYLGLLDFGIDRILSTLLQKF